MSRIIMYQLRCTVCGKSFHRTRRDAKTCSAACRQRAYRNRHPKSARRGMIRSVTHTTRSFL